MLKSYLYFWKDAFNYKGSVKTKEFWLVALLNLIILVGTGFLTNLGIVFTIIHSILASVILILMISHIIRRLNDAGKRKIDVLWILLPLIGWVFLIIDLSKKSQ